MKTDTPETDEKSFEKWGHEHVFADFARTLERQRDEANREAAHHKLTADFLEACERSAKKEAFEARAEAQRLREALNDIIGTLEAHEVDTLDCDRAGRKFCTCLERRIEKAQKALAVPTVATTDTPPRIKTAHGKEWWVHDGANKCPCAGELLISVLFRDGIVTRELPAGVYRWKFLDTSTDVIAWRPADAPDKLPREGGEG